MTTRTENLRKLKSVKKALNFLNANFPKPLHGPKRFRALLPPASASEWMQNWHFITDDWFLYNSKDNPENEDFLITKEAIRQKFPELKAIFCYQYYITTEIQKKKGFLVIE